MVEKIDNVLNNIGIKGKIKYPLSHNAKNYITYCVIDDVSKYKKGVKIAKNIYKKFDFDTLVFKADFIDDGDKEHNIIDMLNKFIDVCQIKKPVNMKKTLKDEKCKNSKNLERIYFYWNLKEEKIDIDTLFKEIIFMKEDGLEELNSSVFFIDSENEILFNFYNMHGIEIVSSSNENLYKFL